MKKKLTKQMLLGVLAAAMFGISANDAEAQSFTNTGGGTYNATCGAVIKLKSATTATPAVQATISGNELGTSTKPIPGVVEWAAASGTQVVQPYHYQKMILTGGSTKTVSTGIFVLGEQCPVAQPLLTGYEVLANYPYAVVTTGGNRSGEVTYEAGTFTYGGDANQNIFPTVTGDATTTTVGAYSTLALSGGSTATIREGETVSTNVINSAGIDGATEETTLSIVGNLNITGTGPATSTLAGNVDLVAGTTTNGTLTTGAGPVIISGNTTTADNTTITVAGVGSLDFDGTLALNGDLVNNGGGSVGATGDINFDGAVTVSSTGTVTLGNNANLLISNSITNAGDGSNLALNCGSNVTYDGGAGQLVLPTGAGTYGNLVLTGGNKVGGVGGTGTLYYDVALCGNFELAGGNFDMYKSGANSGTLIMTDATKGATYAALEEVIGSMRRTTDADARTYTFNNTATTMALAANGAGNTNPTTMTLNVQPATAPNKYDNTKDVNRKVTLAYDAAVPANPFTFDAKVGYRFSEISTWDVANTQSQLRFYEAQTAAGDPEKVGTGKVYGKVESASATANDAFGTLALAGIGNTEAAVPNGIGLFASGNDLLMRAGATTFYSKQDGRWTNPNTWDEGTIPTAIDNAELRHSVYVGIDGGFIGSLAADNQTPEDGNVAGGHYASGAAAAKDVRIVNKAGAFASNNPALIIGNEDNGTNYIFRIAGELANENITANSSVAFPLATAKADLDAGNIQGVWLINSYGTGTPGLGFKSVTNAGTINNEGVVEVGE